MTDSKAWLADQVQAGMTGVELPGPGEVIDDQAASESSADEQYAWFYALSPEDQARAQVDGAFGAEMYDRWLAEHPEDEPADEEVLPDEGDYDEEGRPLEMVDASSVDPRTAEAYSRAWAGEAARGVPRAMSYATFWANVAGQRSRIEAVRRGEASPYDLNDEDEAENLRGILAAKIEAGRQKWGPR